MCVSSTRERDQTHTEPGCVNRSGPCAVVGGRLCIRNEQHHLYRVVLGVAHGRPVGHGEAERNPCKGPRCQHRPSRTSCRLLECKCQVRRTLRFQCSADSHSKDAHSGRRWSSRSTGGSWFRRGVRVGKAIALVCSPATGVSPDEPAGQQDCHHKRLRTGPIGAVMEGRACATRSRGISEWHVYCDRS
jgi:hypothetical protein